MVSHVVRSSRCWARISGAWQMMQLPRTSSMWRPGGSGPLWALARAAATAATPSAAVRERTLRHIDADGVDDVPAVALRVRRAARRLVAAERVARPRHQGVAPRLRLPRVLPAAPGVAVLVAPERGWRPRLAAVGGDVDRHARTLAGPREPPRAQPPRRARR